MTQPTTLDIDPDTPLMGSLNVDDAVANFSDHHLVKGMFIVRCADRLDPEDWARVRPQLVHPPRLGRYVPFKDYPQADHFRLVAAAAARTFPDCSLREAIRRLARDDFEIFARSTLGKVMMTMVNDARGALLKAPLAYSKVAPGDWTFRAYDLDEHHVRLEFIDWPGTGWEYQIGQFEGITMYYGAWPVTTVHLVGEGHIQLDVRHDAYR